MQGHKGRPKKIPGYVVEGRGYFSLRDSRALACKVGPWRAIHVHLHARWALAVSLQRRAWDWETRLTAPHFA
jgi:hypothetical protein